MNKKIEKLFDAYKRLLLKRVAVLPKGGPGTGKGSGLRAGAIRKGNTKKRKILKFFAKNGRWPKRTSEDLRERTLAQSFENFVSKESLSADPQFRRIAMATGRTTNHKRKHDVAGFKQQVLEFIQKNGHVPKRYREETKDGEGNLRAKLDYYTLKKNDMTFLGEIYSLDKCHKSAIPMRFRPLINEALKEVEVPLVRMAKYELEGK